MRNHNILATIDQLPDGVAWKLQTLKLTGDKLDVDGKALTEDLELWWRDPLEVIKDLMGNPAFCEVMKYAPEKLFEDVAGERAIVNQMWTAEWWWQLQQTLPFGATIVPMILSLDKTRLSQFHGDKSAWPVYLTLGNILKSIHRDASSHTTMGKFDCYTKKARQFARYRLFHHCMSIIMKSVAEAGQTGSMVTCADAFFRKVWPILAAYVADYPEQCLIACCKENHCLICTVAPDKQGENCSCPYRDPTLTLEMLKRKSSGELSPAFNKEWDDLGLRPVFQPFWQDLPHSNIFQVFTPDLLHQLHKGVFKDHLVQWSMVDHPGLRHFKNGISGLSQTTGHEHKAMEQVFLGVVAGAVPDHVVKAVKAALDFIYYSSLHSHTSQTLAALTTALDNFHTHKDIFIELGIREHFNIPKIHSMQHYVTSNGCDYTIQMTTWLCRQEAVDRFSSFLSCDVNGPTDSTGILSCPSSSVVPYKQVKTASNSAPLGFHVASTHPRGLLSISASVIIQGHHAMRFLESLTVFLRAHGCRLTPQGFDTFDLFKRITVELPAIPQASPKELKNIICATPPIPAQGHRAAEDAHLDFTYIQTGERNKRTEGTPVQGLRAAHVHVLFRLSTVYGIKTAVPLAYTPSTGLYAISQSTRMGHIYREIIEVDRIV
ncbi:hypothetical protein EDD18DRAFT_1313532 [Armillaria luteobubalina]|uniref:Uncharacterized protein n=1 Tax=Armillaria luteobubalina TaxID=153913 RepID=A0AA39T9L4_9AGAR|nr:hypothetical protein EDD18DRAFT_1313532 [Armillaria luteobubalina]